MQLYAHAKSFTYSFPSGGWKWINTGERGPVARRFRRFRDKTCNGIAVVGLFLF